MIIIQEILDFLGKVSGRAAFFRSNLVRAKSNFFNQKAQDFWKNGIQALRRNASASLMLLNFKKWGIKGIFVE